MFLAINYLNVVPVPPLDGGHIVQAMLPARWYGLRIGFLVLACAAGAAAAFGFGLIGLAVIMQRGSVTNFLPILPDHMSTSLLTAIGLSMVSTLPIRRANPACALRVRSGTS